MKVADVGCHVRVNGSERADFWMMSAVKMSGSGQRTSQCRPRRAQCSMREGYARTAERARACEGMHAGRMVRE